MCSSDLGKEGVNRGTDRLVSQLVVWTRAPMMQSGCLHGYCRARGSGRVSSGGGGGDVSVG